MSYFRSRPEKNKIYCLSDLQQAPMLRYTRRALKPNSIGPFHKAIGRDLSSRMKKKREKARYTVWKNEKFSLTLKRFCENCLQFNSIIKASNSRKFCEKMVKVILRKFHTVQYHRSRNQTASRSRNSRAAASASNSRPPEPLSSYFVRLAPSYKVATLSFFHQHPANSRVVESTWLSSCQMTKTNNLVIKKGASPPGN